jgi:hypothetical protein
MLYMLFLEVNTLSKELEFEPCGSFSRGRTFLPAVYTPWAIYVSALYQGQSKDLFSRGHMGIICNLKRMISVVVPLAYC